MPDHALWTDWVTSMATAGTAVVAAVGAWVAVLVYRRDSRREMPIIEPDFAWKVDPTLGRYIEATLKIVNRLDETLVINSATVSRPRSGTISEGESKVDASGRGSNILTASSKRTIKLSWNLQARGSYTTIHGPRILIGGVSTSSCRRLRGMAGLSGSH